MEQNKKHEERQLVIFKLANEEFGVDISEVKEIVKLGETIKIPESEEYIEGVINLRGNVIVTMNLAKKLELSENRSPKSRIIITEISKSDVGLIIDDASEVLRVSAENIQPAPKMITDRIKSHFIEGVAVVGKRLIILIELKKILDEDDIGIINNVKGKSSDKKNVEKVEVKNKDTIENLPATQAKRDVLIEKNKDGKKEKNIQIDTKTKVPHEFHFITHTGGRLSDVHELHEYIASLDEGIFRNYVNEHKNDFYNWIKHAVKDTELAEKIMHIKNKEQISNEILEKIKREI